MLPDQSDGDNPSLRKSIELSGKSVGETLRKNQPNVNVYGAA